MAIVVYELVLHLVIVEENTLEIHYYLFSPGYSIIKVLGNEQEWYRRDRANHLWIRDDAWSVLFYASEFDLIEIDYDEKQEKILSRRRLPCFFSASDNVLFEFEND